MKAFSTLLAALAMISLFALTAEARVCPVTGQQATGDYFADYEGRRVYFSCPLAKQEFLAHTERYLQALEEADEDQRGASLQRICPVSGEKVNRSVFADFNGKRIYLHCELDQAKFLETPETYFNKLVEDGVALEDAPTFNPHFLGASEGFRFVN